MDLPSPGPRLVRMTPALQLAVVGVYVIPVGLAIWLDPRWHHWVDWGLIALGLGSPLVFGAACALGWWVGRERGPTRPDGTEHVLATVGNVFSGAALLFSLFLWGALLVFSYAMRDF